MTVRDQRAHRRGAIVLLSAFLLVFLLAMVAFAVDIAWIVLTKNQLQNAADAAALAGADPLMDAFVQYQLAPAGAIQTTILNTALATARSNAKNYSSYNRGGDVGSLTINDSDIEFGFIDASGKYTTTYSGMPNTIKITVRRDSTANGSLGLFFAPVLGKSSQDLMATAAATIQAGTIDNFSLNSPDKIRMLPMTYDQAAWNNFLQTGLDPDGNKTIASNGLAEIQVYPSIKAPGNFGQLSLNDSHVGESTEENWVANGMSSLDLATLQRNNLVPLSAHPANTWDWQGDTGFKSALVQDVNNYVNQVFVIPLFQAKNPGSGSSYQPGVGQGSNYFFDIVQFVGIKIMPSPDTNRQVIVQPAAYMSPFAVMTNVQPAGTQSTLVTTFATPKLTY